MRIGKNEALYSYLNKFHPELVKDEYFRPHDTAVIEVPQKAPLLGITRKESIFSLLNRIKKYNMEWVRGGHRKGDNYNNVSATLSVKPNEWELVGEWMWENRNNYNGLAVIPFSEDDHTHVQMPFEEIDETEFNIMSEKLKEIDITQIKENGDYTDLQGEAACAAGACEIT
jgi:ribonucleoside-diphosphate reductase alpha chain